MAARRATTVAVAIAALAAFASPAGAAVILTASVGDGPRGGTLVNFDSLPIGNAAGTAGGLGVMFSGGAEAMRGTGSGRAAAPFLSGGNGAGFGAAGGIQAAGADATTYLTTGNGSVTLALPSASRYFGILWGSVDASNTLAFYQGATLVRFFTGSDVVASPTGDQGVNGTFYVSVDFTGSDAFDRVVLSSGGTPTPFEADNVAYGPTAAAPLVLVSEPGALAVLGAGLLGLLATRGRRRAVA